MGQHWDDMVRSAYRKKGRQHSGLIITIHAGIKAAPALLVLGALGGLVYAIRWGWMHLPHGQTALIALATIPVVLLAARAVRNRGLPVPRPLVFAASTALMFAAVASVMLR